MSAFRISMWPGGPIDPPEILRWSVEILDDLGEFGGPYLKLRPADSETAEVPDELYLRELPSLDADDAHAMAEFYRTYGRLGAPGWTELHPDRPLCTFALDSLKLAFAKKHLPEWDPWTVQRLLYPMAEARVYVCLLRNMTRVWQWHKGLMGWHQLRSSWENPEPPALRNQGRPSSWSAPENPHDAMAGLAQDLGYALSAFRVRPILLVEDNEQTWVEDPGVGDPSLYAVLCLHLANHIAEDAEYRTCQRCGNLFYRQRGRAQFGQQRTTGRIEYCSKECAHQAAQQRYYKRQKATKKGEVNR